MNEAAAVLYLRLPARAEASAAARQADALRFALPFALAVRGRLQRQGFAAAEALSEPVRQAHRIVLLLAASDVTVLRVAVPPLPSSRLGAALPALVEDRIIGDPSDCVLAAGPDEAGLRTVAIVDRAWLQQWADRLRASGARRLSALPVQLCLPLPAGRVAAALLNFPHALHTSSELVLRLGAGECAGLSLGDARAEAAAPHQVLQSAAALAGGRPLWLSVPAGDLDQYQQILPSEAETTPDVELRADRWEDWIDGAAQADVDLISGLSGEAQPAIDWSRWRLPLALAAAALLLNVLALNGDWWQLHREGSQLRSDMQRLYRASFPDDAATEGSALSDPLGTMKQRVAALRRAAGEAAPDDFLALSAALGDVWPALQQGAGMDARAVSAIEYRDGGLQLRLRQGAQPGAQGFDAARRLLAERRLLLSAGSEANSWLVRSAP